MTKLLRSKKDNATDFNGSDVNTNSAPDTLELLPAWGEANVRWGAAWDVHLVVFESLFLLQVLLALGIGVRFCRKTLRHLVIVYVLGFVSGIGMVRFAFFLVDPYGFERTLSGVAVHLFVQAINPLVCASYGFVQMIVVKITGIEIGSVKLRSQTSVLSLFAACSLCMLAVHGVVALDHKLKAILLLDNCVFVVWMMFMCVTFVCSGFRLSQYALEARRAREEFRSRQRRKNSVQAVTDSESKCCACWTHSVSVLPGNTPAWFLNNQRNCKLYHAAVDNQQICCIDDHRDNQTNEHRDVSKKESPSHSVVSQNFKSASEKDSEQLLKFSSSESYITGRSSSPKYCHSLKAKNRPKSRNCAFSTKRRHTHIPKKYSDPGTFGLGDSRQDWNCSVSDDDVLKSRSHLYDSNSSRDDKTATSGRSRRSRKHNGLTVDARRLSSETRPPSGAQTRSHSEEILSTESDQPMNSSGNSYFSLVSRENGSRFKESGKVFELDYNMYRECHISESCKKVDDFSAYSSQTPNKEPQCGEQIQKRVVIDGLKEFSCNRQQRQPDSLQRLNTVQSPRSLADNHGCVHESESVYCEISLSNTNEPDQDVTDSECNVQSSYDQNIRIHHADDVELETNSEGRHYSKTNSEGRQYSNSRSRACLAWFEQAFTLKRRGFQKTVLQEPSVDSNDPRSKQHEGAGCVDPADPLPTLHVSVKRSKSVRLTRQDRGRRASQQGKSSTKPHSEQVHKQEHFPKDHGPDMETTGLACFSEQLSGRSVGSVAKREAAKGAGCKGRVHVLLCCHVNSADQGVSSLGSEEDTSSDDEGYMADNEHPPSPFLVSKSACRRPPTTLSQLPLQIQPGQLLVPDLASGPSRRHHQRGRHLRRASTNLSGQAARSDLTHSETTFTLLPEDECDEGAEYRVTTFRSVPSSSSFLSTFLPQVEAERSDESEAVSPRFQTSKLQEHRIQSATVYITSSDDCLAELSAKDTSYYFENSLDDSHLDPTQSREQSRTHAQNPSSADLFRIRRAGMVSRVVQGMYVLSFVHMFLCLLQLYKAFGRYGVLWSGGGGGAAGSDTPVSIPSPWPWLTFQSLCR